MGAVDADLSGEFDAVVIGGGYGGATAAALLTLAGRRVALVEKTPRAGGKTQTLDRKGYRYEMFGAVGIPAAGSRFHELVDVLGLGDRVELLIPEGPKASVQYRSPDGEWRLMRSELRQTGSEAEIDNLRRLYDATDDDLAAMGDFYLTMLGLTDDEVAALDEVGMAEYMAPFGLPTGLASQIF